MAFSLSLLLPLAFVLPPTLRPTAHVCRTRSTPHMCQWNDFDEAALHEAINRCHSSTRLGEPAEALAGLTTAHVLIFNPGMPDEGVYTLQGALSRSSSYVLTFESTDDADRFAQLLQADGFDLARPMEWNVYQLEAFCKAGQFEVSLVPDGSLITPPAKNEFDTDAFTRLEGDEPPVPREDKYISERIALERMFMQPPAPDPEL